MNQFRFLATTHFTKSHQQYGPAKLVDSEFMELSCLAILPSQQLLCCDRQLFLGDAGHLLKDTGWASRHPLSLEKFQAAIDLDSAILCLSQRCQGQTLPMSQSCLYSSLCPVSVTESGDWGPI